LKSKSGWKPYWNHDNNNGTNSSGFNALPGGYYDDHYRKFSDIGYRGQWWSSSEVTPDYTAYQVYRKICNSSDRIRKDDNYSKLNCKSVRCLKD